MIDAKLNATGSCATGTNADVTALILAGGKSRRFGSDKAMATIPGTETTILGRTFEISRSLAPRVLISSPNRIAYTEFGVELIEDIYPCEGPAGGIVSALTGIETGRLLILACDQIRLTSDILMTLLAALGKSEAAAFEDTETNAILPLPFALDVSLARSKFIRAFHQGERSVRTILSSLDVTRVSLASAQTDALFDVDTIEDLYRASKFV